MKRTKVAVQKMTRTKPVEKTKFPKPSMPFNPNYAQQLKERKWKALGHDDKFPPWGAYPSHIIKKIPAEYLIKLYKDGWACGAVREYIEQYWKKLNKRMKKERKSGRDIKYKKKWYQVPPEYYNKPNKNKSE